MESGDRGAQTVDRAASRFRHFAICAVLVAVAFIQTPGRIVADTKLDLVVDPGGFLARALSIWDDEGFFGQLQNQAYGYAFPMGPFFWVGELLNLPEWVIQRLWWSLILCVAYLGVVKLCTELGIGTPVSRILAGLFFALSPRMLSVMGWHSIETWPTAMAPWVLVPLVIGINRHGPRRMAALSALAVFAIGGVNAVATFAATPLAAWWLWCAPRGPRRTAMLCWWPPLVLAAVAWWLGALFVLGAYSPPFLDFIESSQTATLAATPLDALRGATNWIPYVSIDANSGRDLITDPVVIMNAGILLVIGLAGLAMATMPHRRVFGVAVFVGMVAVSLGHVGAVDGWGAAAWQSALDGVLSPLRNNHKFDVLIRLPIALGVAHAIGSWLTTAQRDRLPYQQFGAVLVVASALIGATMPAWSGRLANNGAFEELPGYWPEAAHWLEEHADGTALLLPSSAFGTYAWGSTGDEPIQPLANSAWAVRNSVPLTSASTIRWLDAITDQVAQGQPSRELASTLARAGVSHVVVRNDLRADIASGRTESVYSTLNESPGLSLVASFGPQLGGTGFIDLGEVRTFARGGWQADRPAVEIFSVDLPAQDPALLASLPVVSASSDALPRLTELGVIDSDAVLLRDHTTGGPRRVVVTDALRRQEVAFGSVDRMRSATMEPLDYFIRQRALHDYLEPGDRVSMTSTQLYGATSLTSPYSRSNVDFPGSVRAGALPYAAFDGDSRSAWQSWTNEGELRAEFGTAIDLTGLSVSANLAPGETQDIVVHTDDDEFPETLVGTEPAVFDAGLTTTLTISGVRTSGEPFNVAEVSAPELAVSRELQVPVPSAQLGPISDIVLGVNLNRRPGCLNGEFITSCRYGISDRGEDAYELRRSFSVTSADELRVEVRTRAFNGAAFDELVQAELPMQIGVTSSVNDDPRSSGVMMIDGRSRTGWIADPHDTDPSIVVRSENPQTFDQIELHTEPGLPASRVAAITIRTESGETRQALAIDGVAEFDELTASEFEINLESAGDAQDYIDDRLSTILPVGISALQIGDLQTLDLESQLMTACGAGPELTVGEQVIDTMVIGTVADFLSGAELEASPCGTDLVELPQGQTRLMSRASELFEAGTVRLQSTRPEATVPVPITGSEVAVNFRHNSNPGWQPSIADAETIVLNGWQQGMVTGGRPDLVGAEFAPQTRYLSALGVGLVLLVAVMVVAVWPSRRDYEPTSVNGRRRQEQAVRVFAVPEGESSSVLPQARVSSTATVLLAAVSIGLIAGTPGLFIAVFGAAVAVISSRWPVARAAVVVGPVLLAITSYAVWSWGRTGAWAGGSVLPHYLVIFALGALVVSFLWSKDRP